MSDLLPMECPRCRQQGRESEVRTRGLYSHSVNCGATMGYVCAETEETARGARYECSNGHRWELWWTD
jgi:hypothetical protein